VLERFVFHQPYGTVRYGIELYCIVYVIVDVIVLSVLCVSTIDLIVGSGWDKAKQSKRTLDLSPLDRIVSYCVVLCCVAV